MQVFVSAGCVWPWRASIAPSHTDREETRSIYMELSLVINNLKCLQKKKQADTHTHFFSCLIYFSHTHTHTFIHTCIESNFKVACIAAAASSLFWRCDTRVTDIQTDIQLTQAQDTQHKRWHNHTDSYIQTVDSAHCDTNRQLSGH